MSTRVQRLIVSLAVLACVLSLPACAPPGPTQTAGGKPAVQVVSPLAGATIPANTTVSVQFTALDAQGITRVELWVDSTLVASQNLPQPASSYQGTLVWVASTAGAHALLVRAHNAAGAVSDPALIGVLVGGPAGAATVVAQPPATPGGPTPSPPAPTPAQPGLPTQTASTTPPTAEPTPGPTSTASGTVYDLVAQANQAWPWRNSPGSVDLQFGEEHCGDAGCAFWRTAPNTAMEDGSTPARVLVTRPQRVQDGGIMKYQKTPFAIQAGDRLVGKVGLLAGPAAAGEIRFQVNIRDEGKPSAGHKITVDLYDTADGQLKSFDVPLAEWAGRSVTFMLVVWGDGSLVGDRAAWVELRVVRP